MSAPFRPPTTQNPEDKSSSSNNRAPSTSVTNDVLNAYAAPPQHHHHYQFASDDFEPNPVYNPALHAASSAPALHGPQAPIHTTTAAPPPAAYAALPPAPLPAPLPAPIAYAAPPQPPTTQRRPTAGEVAAAQRRANLTGVGGATSYVAVNAPAARHVAKPPPPPAAPAPATTGYIAAAAANAAPVPPPHAAAMPQHTPAYSTTAPVPATFAQQQQLQPPPVQAPRVQAPPPQPTLAPPQQAPPPAARIAPPQLQQQQQSPLVVEQATYPPQAPGKIAFVPGARRAQPFDVVVVPAGAPPLMAPSAARIGTSQAPQQQHAPPQAYPPPVSLAPAPPTAASAPSSSTAARVATNQAPQLQQQHAAPPERKLAYRPPVPGTISFGTGAAPPTAPAAASASPAKAPPAPMDRRKQFLVFVKILLKHLEKHAEDRIRAQAKRILTECIARNRQGDPDYAPLHLAAEARILPIVGPRHWNKSVQYLNLYLKKQADARFQSAQQQQQRAVQI